MDLIWKKYTKKKIISQEKNKSIYIGEEKNKNKKQVLIKS